MIVTEQTLFFELKMELGEVLFQTVLPSFFRQVVEKKSLVTWSIYFPKIVRGIMIKQENALTVKHPQTGVICRSYMYKVPKFNPEDEYISYEQVFYPGNLVLNQASSNLPVMNNLLGAISDNLPNSQYYGVVRYSFSFTPPDIIAIDPIPMSHLDFSVNMQRKLRLSEVPVYYRDEFMQLCVADCKYALYNKFKHLKNGTTYQGVEINTDLLTDLQSGKDERKELLEEFKKNYWKDPSRYAAFMEYEQFS